MTENQESKCPTCGGEMVAKDGRSFCPACLLQQGMQPSTFAGNAVFQNWSPPAIEYLADRFPQLHIESLLGQGGMGAVYKVRQKELDRPAALKVLPDVAGHDPGFTERFLREARLLASLSHPHIVTVYEFGQREGVYFLLMEYIDGITLRQASLADPIKRLSTKEALAVVGQLCDALQFAHDEGVVHRDIKPENILIDRRGRVKIADFGLAKLLGKPADLPTLTKTHQLMGTPAYMAPEQIEGQPVIDHRADIYSLGVVFYELLTGELPLGRFQPPSQKADLDARLDEVVLRTLEKEPDRRYQQASQVRTDMDAIRSPASAANRGKRWAVVRPLLYVLAGVVLTLVSTSSTLSPEGIMRIVFPDRVETRRPDDNVHIPIDVPVAMIAAPPVAAGNSGGMSEFYGGDVAGEGADYENAMGGFDYEGFEPPQNQGPVLEFTEDRVTLRPDVAALDATQLKRVNQILSEVHQQYLQLEADRSIVTTPGDGTVQTVVYRFPREWQRLEDELWTRLDDSLNVDQQRELRRILPVTSAPSGGGMSGLGGGMGRGGGGFAMMGGGGASLYPLPGLLGWTQNRPTDGKEDRTVATVGVRRAGSWFKWTVSVDGGGYDYPTAPELPPELRRFNHEPGPLVTIGNANAAFRVEEWDTLLQYFTTRCLIRWAADSNARLQAASLTDATFGNPGSPDELGALVLTKTLMAMPAAYQERIGGSDGNQTGGILIDKYGREIDIDKQTEILNQLVSLDTPERMMILFSWFSMFSVLDAIEFPFCDVVVSQVLRSEDTATAVLRHRTGGTSSVSLVLIDNQWKIDQMDIDWKSIGLPDDVTTESDDAPEPTVKESSPDIPESPDLP